MLLSKTALSALSKKLASSRVMSTVAEAPGSGLVMAVGTTFVTYMTADFLSNFIQHPTQKVSNPI